MKFANASGLKIITKTGSDILTMNSTTAPGCYSENFTEINRLTPSVNS